MFKTLLSAFLVVAIAFASKGVDVTQPVGVSTWSCMKDRGFDFAVVRVYALQGTVDHNGPFSINNAWAAGISNVEGYITPCFSCGNPAKQMDDTIDYLASHVAVRGLRDPEKTSTKLGATVNRLWLNIEGGPEYWSNSTSKNLDFIVALAEQGVKRGVSLGVFTNQDQWNAITDKSTALSAYPLWYAHHDESPLYNDFAAFGGWAKPAQKQYTGNTYICSDVTWRVDSINN